MKSLKAFLRPNMGKIVVFIVIIVLAHMPYVGYSLEEVSCIAAPCPPIEIPNPVLYPFYLVVSGNSWYWGSLTTIFERALERSMGGKSNTPSIFLYVIFTLLYWVLLSIVIYWFWDKKLKQYLKRNKK